MAMAVQSARDYRERLEEAIRDPLTGVYNRRFLLEALDKEILRAERYGSSASLVLFDLDDFKDINDTHGHAAGDAVLRRLAEVVQSTVRPSDSFARMGGEEFALLLPETSQLEALLVAERIRTALSRLDVMPDRRVTLSGGVASCPDDAGDSEQLRRRADEALALGQAQRQEPVRGLQRGDRPERGDRRRRRPRPPLRARRDDRRPAPAHARPLRERRQLRGRARPSALGLEHDRVVRLRRAALLHDVGKVSVSAAILDKPAALTDEEYAQIKGHAPVGGTLLAHAGLPEESRWVRHHHERRGRARLPGRPRGRGDPARGADHLRRRLVRGDDLRPALPRRHAGRRRAGRAAALRRRPVRPRGRRGDGGAAGRRRADRARPARGRLRPPAHAALSAAPRGLARGGRAPGRRRR